MTVKLIIDSTTNLKDGLENQVDYIVPLTVHFGDEEYLDGIEITNHEFYTKLIEGDLVPTTSQPTPEAFDNVLKKATDNGDPAIIITLASSLSGTYQSARLAADSYDDVYVVDSNSVTIGAGILVEHAINLINMGLDVKEIVKELEEKKGKIRLLASLDTLEYLKKGGRISKTVAFAGGLLNIKPLVEVVDGAIGMVGKARGSKKVKSLLTDEVMKNGGIDFDMPILLGYSGLSDEDLLKYIDSSKSIWEDKRENLDYSTIGSVVGTHAGPGAVGFAYFKKID